MKDFSMFKYFKGEDKNPFDSNSQNAQSMFWDYESIFEEKFNSGNFKIGNWISPAFEDIKEWENVLSENNVNKEELFKLWIFNLLTVNLTDKYQTEKDHFIRLYFDTEL